MDEDMDEDIVPLKNGINIDDIGPSDKFVEFVKYKSDDPAFEDIITAKNTMTLFYSNSLYCPKIDKTSKFLSLHNMVQYLKKHIKNEIENEVELQRIIITKKIESKYGADKLIDRLRNENQSS